MKCLLYACVAGLLVSSAAGCLHHQVENSHGHACAGGNCVHGEAGLLGAVGGRAAAEFHETRGWRHSPPEAGPPGPPSGTYGYPYYTLRGPRDFLDPDPPSIGN